MGFVILILTWITFGGVAVKINEWFIHGDSSVTILIMIIELATFLYIWAKNDELISMVLKDYFFISIKPRVKKIKPISRIKAEKYCRRQFDKCLPHINKYLKIDDIPLLEERLFYTNLCERCGKEFVDDIYKPWFEEYKLFRDKDNIIRSMKLYKKFKEEGWI